VNLHIYPYLVSRCLRRGVLEEVLRLLCFINYNSLNVEDERKDFIKSELSFLTSDVEEKVPFSSGSFNFCTSRVASLYSCCYRSFITTVTISARPVFFVS
jgi:hypothetical protein